VIVQARRRKSKRILEVFQGVNGFHADTETGKPFAVLFDASLGQGEMTAFIPMVKRFAFLVIED